MYQVVYLIENRDIKSLVGVDYVSLRPPKNLRTRCFRVSVRPWCQVLCVPMKNVRVIFSIDLFEIRTQVKDARRSIVSILSISIGVIGST